jgi:hypothetical protein
MLDLIILAVMPPPRLCVRPGGVRAVVAESILAKHQLPILSRCRVGGFASDGDGFHLFFAISFCAPSFPAFPPFSGFFSTTNRQQRSAFPPIC